MAFFSHLYTHLFLSLSLSLDRRINQFNLFTHRSLVDCNYISDTQTSGCFGQASIHWFICCSSICCIAPDDTATVICSQCQWSIVCIMGQVVVDVRLGMICPHSFLFLLSATCHHHTDCITSSLPLKDKTQTPLLPLLFHTFRFWFKCYGHGDEEILTRVYKNAKRIQQKKRWRRSRKTFKKADWTGACVLNRNGHRNRSAGRRISRPLFCCFVLFRCCCTWLHGVQARQPIDSPLLSQRMKQATTAWNNIREFDNNNSQTDDILLWFSAFESFLLYFSLDLNYKHDQCVPLVPCSTNQHLPLPIISSDLCTSRQPLLLLRLNLWFPDKHTYTFAS